MTITLAELTRMSGLDVLDHLELEVSIPVINGPQAQGDLIVIPLATLNDVTIPRDISWSDVPPSGAELLRAAGGGNPHLLAADPHSCQWTRSVRDDTGLAIAALRNTRPGYLIHPEHGGSGIAPGTWVVRRQRERGTTRPSFGSSRRDIMVFD